ncbi:MAG: hypothetical protein KJO07_24820 [Deltaproteobacteria bacterium]|nr:hypothetical protein [Deltaproteobacteria bacterium]
MRKSVIAIGSLAAAAALATSASAHELQAYVSLSGIEFLEAAAPTLVPESIDGVELEKTLFECGSRPVTAKQSKTTVSLAIHELQIDLPEDDRLQVEMNFSVSGDGELYLQNPYACFGEATCNDEFFVNNATAYIDFNIEVEAGKPVLTVHDLTLDVAEDDIDFNLSGEDCTGLDNIANSLVDFGRDYLLDEGLGLVSSLATDSLGPALSEMLVGFNGVQGDFDRFSFDAQLRETDLSIAGLKLVGDIDVSSRYQPATCIDNDPGEPATHQGPAPIIDMTSSDVGVAANYGLVDDALYHAWRRGMMCINESTLEGLGLDTHHLMDEVAKLLPGFPVGTEYGIEVRAKSPPRVQGSAADGGGMTLYVEGLQVEIIGRKPDGKSGTLMVELDLSLDANMGVDPTRNVMTMSFGEASIDRLFIKDEIAAAEAGFDAARIRTVVGDYIMPAMLDEMSGMPLMAPIFGFGGVYIILQEANLGQAFLSAKLDLYLAPDDDDVAPDTRITDQPSGIANPKTAILSFEGSDDQVPAQLIQYKVTVDGEAAEPSFIKQTTIGEIGVTKTYQVEVAAVDLSGNEDPSPETVELLVDGVAPGLAIRGSRVREVGGSTATIAWTASDDHSDAGQLRATLEVYRLNNKKDSLDKQLVDTINVPAGQTETQVKVNDGDLYRVEVIVEDEAGNQSRSSVTVRTPGYGGGCSASGSGTGLPIGLSFGLLMLVVARRRRD